MDRSPLAGTATPKRIQSTFLCVSHILLELFKRMLENDHNIRNEAELACQQSRLVQKLIVLAQCRPLSALLYTLHPAPPASPHVLGKSCGETEVCTPLPHFVPCNSS